MDCPSPVAFLPVREGGEVGWCLLVSADPWLHLRRAFLHYLCSHDWYDHLDAGEKDKARVDAKVSMRTYAEFVESKLGIEYCTINLRLLTVHSYEQEIQTGPIKHTLEF